MAKKSLIRVRNYYGKLVILKTKDGIPLRYGQKYYYLSYDRNRLPILGDVVITRRVLKRVLTNTDEFFKYRMKVVASINSASYLIDSPTLSSLCARIYFDINKVRRSFKRRLKQAAKEIEHDAAEAVIQAKRDLNLLKHRLNIFDRRRNQVLRLSEQKS